MNEHNVRETVQEHNAMLNYVHATLVDRKAIANVWRQIEPN